MTRLQGRKRSKLACQTCRDLKRRCDGAHPCGTCVRFEYDCTYQSNKMRKVMERSQPVGRCSAESTPLARQSTTSSPHAHDGASPPTPQLQAQSLEANSASAFVRKLASRLDPKRNSRMQTFAWNAFLGCRQTKPPTVPVPQDITHLLSQKRMQELATLYFQKVDPTYGFVDHYEVSRHIQQRWTIQAPQPAADALLCGIAALACLFSQVHTDPIELHLVESARALLEQTISMPPTTTSIMAWLLRVVYLRVVGTHYPAWMASCMVMHMIEAASLNSEIPPENVIPPPQQEMVDVELKRRLVAVAQQLNIWMSFEMGRTRVSLSNTTTIMPAAREGDNTRELMELLPFSIELDPERKPTAAELESALHVVLGRIHTSPPSVLGQCNLALCLCRRLRSMEVPLTEPVLQQILMLTSNGIRAAQAVLGARAPWHLMISVPFQIVCVLLAIDTVSSIAQLREAMQCLKDISAVYDTEATQEALKTARSLVMLHQRGKEMFASALNDILKGYPVSPHYDLPMASPKPEGTNLEWLENLGVEFSGPQFFDIDQFLSPGFFWNASSTGF